MWFSSHHKSSDEPPLCRSSVEQAVLQLRHKEKELQDQSSRSSNLCSFTKSVSVVDMKTLEALRSGKKPWKVFVVLQARMLCLIASLIGSELQTAIQDSGSSNGS